MANMSYCRFQNTSNDLRDCAGALEEVLAGNETLSRDELQAAIRLIETAQDIIALLKDATGTDEDAELDSDDVEVALTQRDEQEAYENHQADTSR